MSCSGPRRPPHHWVPSAGKPTHRTSRFCPVPYSKTPLRLSPLLQIIPLTRPSLELKVLISSSAETRKWKRGAKQKVSRPKAKLNETSTTTLLGWLSWKKLKNSYKKWAFRPLNQIYLCWSVPNKRHRCSGIPGKHIRKLECAEVTEPITAPPKPVTPQARGTAGIKHKCFKFYLKVYLCTLSSN